LQRDKKDEQRIWTRRRMKIFDLLPKYRINLVFDESKMKSDLTTSSKLPDAIEIYLWKFLQMRNHR
jgi:hypothetical protein